MSYENVYSYNVEGGLRSYGKTNVYGAMQAIRKQNDPSFHKVEKYSSEQPKKGSSRPEVFGPFHWYMLHNGAGHLPDTLSPIAIKRIIGFIDGIPEFTPCEKCSEHSRFFIESSKHRIQNFKTRDDVFSFFNDFHNYVNKRLGKPEVSLETAKQMWY